MATANGFVITDASYIARRLGLEPPSTTCTVSTTVTREPGGVTTPSESHKPVRSIGR
jgi:hypothetical protein